ncbi:MAG: hypothetical protein ACOYYS_13615 [Chloroflexota bacterium]
MARKSIKTLLSILMLFSLAWGALQGEKWTQPAQAQANSPASLAARSQPLIIDHTTKDVTAIPLQWIEKAKQDLHIFYTHTSHGSQLTDGMGGLVNFANGGGLGLALPEGTFGGLSLDDNYSTDLGNSSWPQITRNYLGAPDPATGRGTVHSDTNVVIWSWCGQVSGISEQDLIDHYLTPMTQLEADYPGITFVYMTGHADGSGESGDLHLRNQQIRQYAIANNKVLYDFYDIELYDPDDNYYGDQYANDELYYDTNGDGHYDRNDDSNWGIQWQRTHTQDVDWYSVGCAHSQAINCNQKAYAAWWLWASLAGWTAAPDLSQSSKSASQPAVSFGDTVTYTVRIESPSTITNTVWLTDTIPAGLSYVPGSLTASSGAADDSQAPTLRWTGVLTPTPTVLVTYAVTVTTESAEFLTNAAVLQIEGHPAITRAVTIIANGYQVFLPQVAR